MFYSRERRPDSSHARYAFNANHANHLAEGGRLVLDGYSVTSGLFILSADEVTDLLVFGLFDSRL
jgi:hypothetical protein